MELREQSEGLHCQVEKVRRSTTLIRNCLVDRRSDVSGACLELSELVSDLCWDMGGLARVVDLPNCVVQHALDVSEYGPEGRQLRLGHCSLRHAATRARSNDE